MAEKKRDRRHSEEVAKRFCDARRQATGYARVADEDLADLLRADRRRVLRAVRGLPLFDHLKETVLRQLKAELDAWERDR